MRLPTLRPALAARAPKCAEATGSGIEQGETRPRRGGGRSPPSKPTGGIAPRTEERRTATRGRAQKPPGATPAISRVRREPPRRQPEGSRAPRGAGAKPPENFGGAHPERGGTAGAETTRAPSSEGAAPSMAGRRAPRQRRAPLCARCDAGTRSGAPGDHRHPERGGSFGSGSSASLCRAYMMPSARPV